MPKLKIDGIEIEIEEGHTVLQACEMAGVEIPRFCYHERLSVAGNCRMCLVDMEKSPKPIASCAMPASEGMVISTNTPRVKKAREGVMEFLLINHPLDCPICDQGGECDLQDQAMAYGVGKNRFHENKRSVVDKNMGPLIKTQMNRCIHCTRCIRFTEEVAGSEEIGALGRGEHMEIMSYLDEAVKTELSGNVIDLCPVGALTSKPYAYKARSWELSSTESVDVMDAVGSSIRVDARGNEVMRILPRLNEAVNEEWISDKTRFACDGLAVQRLDRAYVRKNGKLQEVNLQDAIGFVAQKLATTSPDKISAVCGDMMDSETIYATKKLLSKLGVTNFECRVDGAKIDAQNRMSYLFNTAIAGIEQADLCLLVGTNPRHEATLVNARIGKQVRKRKLKVAHIGLPENLSYKVQELGNDLSILEAISSGQHELCAQLEAAKNPMVIVGTEVLKQEDSDHLLHLIWEICQKYKLIRDDWNGYNYLATAASRVAALDLGFVPKSKDETIDTLLARTRAGAIDIIYLLGADELDFSKLGKDCFVIYQGHHGDKGAARADVILPGVAYTEKNGIYLNLEGRAQLGRKAVKGPGESMEDSAIIMQIAKDCNIDLGFNSFVGLRNHLFTEYPQFAGIDEIKAATIKEFGKKGRLISKKLARLHEIYYFTNVICRASVTMAKCQEILLTKTRAA